MKNGILVVLQLILLCSCDLKNRTEKEYFPDGNIKSKISYKGDQRNGLTEYYFRDGKVKERLYYKDGLLNGEFCSFDSSGRVLSQGHFRNGNAIGPIYYYHLGRLVLYNERDFSSSIYYVRKFDTASAKLIKEEGVCFSRNLIEDFTVDAGTKYRLQISYAEPENSNNTITVLANGNKVPIKKNKQHLGEIEFEMIGGVNTVAIFSVLKSTSGSVLCSDSLFKTFTP